MSECRVHSCVFQQRVVDKKTQPDPLRHCKCREVVSQIEADQRVKCGEAKPLVVARERKEQYKPCKICDGGDSKSSCLFCERTGKMLVVEINEVFGRDIVSVAHRTKTNRVSTPRVPTIEAKHILRAYVSNEARSAVAAAQRTRGEDELDLDLAFTPLGNVSPEQMEQAQKRIEEYGKEIQWQLHGIGAAVAIRITDKANINQRVIHPGKFEPEEKRLVYPPGTIVFKDGSKNKTWWYVMEGRGADYGRAI